MKIGVISDTHGLLRPEAVKALQGCQHIIHAGDLGNLKILSELKRIAPVSIVRGNIDQESWAETLPLSEVVSLPKFQIYILHNLDHMDLDPVKSGFKMVVSGHTHRPILTEKNGVRYLNPGSAGPNRFQLPVSLAILILQDDQMEVQFVDLEKVKLTGVDRKFMGSSQSVMTDE